MQQNTEAHSEHQGRPHTRDEARARRRGDGEREGGEEEGRIGTAKRGSEAVDAQASLSTSVVLALTARG